MWRKSHNALSMVEVEQKWEKKSIILCKLQGQIRIRWVERMRNICKRWLRVRQWEKPSSYRQRTRSHKLIKKSKKLKRKSTKKKKKLPLNLTHLKSSKNNQVKKSQNKKVKQEKNSQSKKHPNRWKILKYSKKSILNKIIGDYLT